MRSRSLFLVVLVFACLLAAGSASAETCRYFCGTTLHQGQSTHCCTTLFQCPDGEMVYPFAYNNGIWRICGATSASASGLCGAGAASLPDWAASEAVPASALTEGGGPPASASDISSAVPYPANATNGLALASSAEQER